MKENESLIDKTILVSMNEINISTDKSPIIATSSLATCIGILLYNEKQKKAMIYHVTANQNGNYEEQAIKIYSELILFLFNNNLEEEMMKYMIIPGAYSYYYNIQTPNQVANELLKIFDIESKKFTKFESNEIPIDAIRLHKETKSLEFAFNAYNGKFVTSKLFPNDLNYTIPEIQKNKINISSHHNHTS